MNMVASLVFVAATLLLQAEKISAERINYLHVVEKKPLVTFVTIDFHPKGKSCQIFTNPTEIVAATKEANAKHEIILEINERELSAIINTCPKSPAFQSFQQGGLIFPGTKWCGPGNIADDYEDLGPETETDMCCRDHDHCDSINEGQSKYNLTNTSPFTRLHCDCDNTFVDCLQKVNSQVGNTIGEFYFNLVKNPCYDFQHPIISCKRQILPRTCEEYEFDESQPKIYQWFLPKYYKKP